MNKCTKDWRNYVRTPKSPYKRWIQMTVEETQGWTKDSRHD